MWEKIQIMYFYLEGLAPVCYLLHIFLCLTKNTLSLSVPQSNIQQKAEPESSVLHTANYYLWQYSLIINS